MARKKATRKHTAKKHATRKRGPKKGNVSLLGLNKRVNKVEDRVNILFGGLGMKHRSPISSVGKSSNYSPQDEGVVYED